MKKVHPNLKSEYSIKDKVIFTYLEIVDVLSSYKTPNIHICSVLEFRANSCSVLLDFQSFIECCFAHPMISYLSYLQWLRESSFNMTRGEGMKILRGGGGGSKNFQTPERGALKKVGGAPKICTLKNQQEGRGLLKS